MSETKRIFIVTGEHSGDMHASFIVKELKELNKDIQIEAIGGHNLKEASVKLFSDHSKMAVVGLDALKSIFSHISLGKRLVDYLQKDYKPDLVLLIDYGGFNLRLAKALKERGIDIYYYISPQVWATRKGRIDVIKKYVSKIMLILPFEEKIYQDKGVNAEYVGHPLISQLPEPTDRETFFKENNIDPNKKLVGIFPGSRKMEINYLMPIFLEAIKKIADQSKDTQFCIAQAPNLSDDLLDKHLKNTDIKVLKNQNHPLIANSDVIIAASGTISLEAALYGTPAVISYKGPYIAYIGYLLMRYIKLVALPNIIADKEIVKEFIQNRAKPDLIANEVLSLLHNEERKSEMISELRGIREKLGDKVASKEVARIINEYLS